MTNPMPLGWGHMRRTDSALAKTFVKCTAKAKFRLVRTPSLKAWG